jgi:hypothetical protein
VTVRPLSPRGRHARAVPPPVCRSSRLVGRLVPQPPRASPSPAPSATANAGLVRAGVTHAAKVTSRRPEPGWAASLPRQQLIGSLSTAHRLPLLVERGRSRLVRLGRRPQPAPAPGGSAARRCPVRAAPVPAPPPHPRPGLGGRDLTMTPAESREHFPVLATAWTQRWEPLSEVTASEGVVPGPGGDAGSAPPATSRRDSPIRVVHLERCGAELPALRIRFRPTIATKEKRRSTVPHQGGRESDSFTNDGHVGSPGQPRVRLA